MFTSADIKKVCSAPELVRLGREGIVSIGDSLVVKEHRHLNGVDADIPCHLAERRRRAIHAFFNALAGGRALAFESGEWSGRSGVVREGLQFVQIEQASSSPSAIGVLKRLHGQECVKPSKRLYEAARVLGAQIDAFGDGNVIMCERDVVRRFTILETIGGIGLEGVLQLQAMRRLNREEYPRALYFYTQAYLLNGVVGVPTVSWEGMQFAIECGFRRMAGDDYFQEVVRPAEFWHGVHQKGSGALSDSLVRHEVARIEGMIGAPWPYQELDLDHFSNAAGFSLDDSLIDDLKGKREEMALASSRIRLSR
jgi:hypothetical protein